MGGTLPKILHGSQKHSGTGRGRERAGCPSRDTPPATSTTRTYVRDLHHGRCIVVLTQDLTQVDDDTLATAIRDAEHLATETLHWSAVLIAELKRRHPWSQVVALTGMRQTTLHNRVHGRPARRSG